eukprot:TRINITY_DN30325_c0_g1_i1.p1 TRINITY_DN30325_c0_g1~~TRINITY_DN30325_c0_g1_i1.p1  ORF type:complete len:409 (+),score=56.13 TRINITY_DN30325_c0_g1_i1:106-1332(+)
MLKQCSLLFQLLIISRAEWLFLYNVTSAQESQSAYPGIRYSHAAAINQNQMIITHGYYYNRGNRQPRWLSDTWAMDLSPPYNWNFLHDHTDEETAKNWYQKNQKKITPAGRFGLAGIALNQTWDQIQNEEKQTSHFFIFGGNEGGYFRHGQNGYQRGYELNEMWNLNLQSLKWSEIEQDKNQNPGSRHLHAMTGMNDKIYIFGGLGKNKGDLWEYNTLNSQWKKISEQEPGPGSRVGAQMVAIQTSKNRGLLLFGGRIQSQQTKSVILPDDVWFFNLNQKIWQIVDILSEQWPMGRMYHGMTTDTERMDGIVYVVGGSLSSPNMKCTNETWAFSLSCDEQKISGKWSQLEGLPFGHYFLSVVVGNGNLFTFGGHVCSFTKGELPYFYLNSVLKLSVEEFRKQKVCGST